MTTPGEVHGIALDEVDAELVIREVTVPPNALAAVAEGFCPACLVPLGGNPRSWCPACKTYWNILRPAPGGR